MKKALLIEDNEDDIAFIKMAHEPFESKFQIDVAKNHLEAFGFLKTNQYFLITLDINLPQMNGLHILKKIKEDPTLKDTPVCILSTSKFEKDIKEAYENGCNSYIEKPFNYKDFIKVVGLIFSFWFKNCNITKKVKNERPNK